MQQAKQILVRVSSTKASFLLTLKYFDKKESARFKSVISKLKFEKYCNGNYAGSTSNNTCDFGYEVRCETKLVTEVFIKIIQLYSQLYNIEFVLEKLRTPTHDDVDEVHFSKLNSLA